MNYLRNMETGELLKGNRGTSELLMRNVETGELLKRSMDLST